MKQDPRSGPMARMRRRFLPPRAAAPGTAGGPGDARPDAEAAKAPGDSALSREGIPGKCSRGALLGKALAYLGREAPREAGAGGLSVAILVGGGSRRMGTDKATLELAGRPLAQHVIDAMRDLSTDLFLVGDDHGAYESFGLPVAGDLHAVRSSLVGVYSALAAASSEYCLVVPCDMPFADPVLARRMVESSPGFDAVVPVSPSGMEPLFALYARSCLEVIGGFIERGDHRITDVLDRLRVRWLTQAELCGLRDPAVTFFNVNTPDDLHRAESIFRAAGRAGGHGAPAVGDRPPLVCFVGSKNSGKTTFLESLVTYISDRGLRVACIKHDVHGFTMDHEGTDTWRLARAGAAQVVISSPGGYAQVASVARERSLVELRSEVAGSADIILVEGFKGAPADKIEVRGDSDAEPACDEGELLALVADEPPAGTSLPVFRRDDAPGVARFIFERYGLAPGKGER